jgi:hypothetical protein
MSLTWYHLIIVLTTFLLQNTNSEHYILSPEMNDVFFLPNKGKWKPMDLQESNFFIKTFTKPKKDKQNTNKFLNDYFIFFKPESAGWLVKKLPGNTEKNIESGDFVFFFENDKATLKLGKAQIQTSKKGKGPSADSILTFLNGPNEGYQKTRIEFYTFLSLTPWDFNVSLKSFVGMLLSHEDVVKKIKKEKKEFNIPNNLKIVEHLTALEISPKGAFINDMIDNAIKSVFFYGEWHSLGDQDHINSIKQGIIELYPALVSQNISILDFAGTTLTFEKLKGAFESVLANDKFNLLLSDWKKYNSLSMFSYLSLPDTKSPEEMAQFAKFMKFRLISQMHFELSRSMTPVCSVLLNTEGFVANAQKLHPANTPRSEIFFTLIQEMETKLKMLSDPLWIEISNWVSQIENLDQFFISYVKETITNTDFAKAFLIDGFLNIRRIYRALAVLKASYAERIDDRTTVGLLDYVDRRNRNLVLV